MSTDSRELTRRERTAIRRLVTGICANYDPEYGCLPLDCECYMLTKWWTGAYCKYFQTAVLPLDTVLEADLAGKPAVGKENAKQTAAANSGTGAETRGKVSRSLLEKALIFGAFRPRFQGKGIYASSPLFLRVTA